MLHSQNNQSAALLFVFSSLNIQICLIYNICNWLAGWLVSGLQCFLVREVGTCETIAPTKTTATKKQLSKRKMWGWSLFQLLTPPKHWTFIFTACAVTKLTTSCPFSCEPQEDTRFHAVLSLQHNHTVLQADKNHAAWYRKKRTGNATQCVLCSCEDRLKMASSMHSSALRARSWKHFFVSVSWDYTWIWRMSLHT